MAQTRDQVAFVIAHELAHYYRAHYARSQSRYTRGFYSHEDEADELATRWLAAIGMDPNAGIYFFSNYLQLFPEAANASTDGDTAKAHSDPCQRAQNIARVIADLSQGN